MKYDHNLHTTVTKHVGCRPLDLVIPELIAINDRAKALGGFHIVLDLDYDGHDGRTIVVEYYLHKSVAEIENAANKAANDLRVRRETYETLKQEFEPQLHTVQLEKKET